MDYLIRRQDRLETDLQCMMCGRVIGQLFGVAWRDTSGRRTPRAAAHLTVFRAATPDARPVALTGRERFRCQHCGGFAVMEEIAISVVGEALPAEATCPIHRDRMRGRGRRPRGCLCRRDLRPAA
jgi:hypothetical protein